MWKRFLERLVTLAVFVPLFIGYASAQDITISSNTTWDEGTHTYTNITVNNGATLTVAGGSTVNVSWTITVTGNSTVLLQGKNTDSQVNGEWAGVGVTLRAGNVQVDAGSRISADGQGYTTSKGPGRGLTTTAGGNYGGRGGNNSGPTYGSATRPVDLGSGGGSVSDGWCWSHGGGAIRLDVSGTLTLNGVVTANGMLNNTGGWGSNVSGGSGGSIYVSATILKGTGNFMANGANGPWYGAGGGGGRIAIYYSEGSGFIGFTSSTASGGGPGGGGAPTAGQNGTIGFFNTTENHLRVTGQQFTLEEDTAVSYSAVTVDGGGTLTIGGGSTIDISGTLALTGNSTLVLQGKNTTGKVDGQWAGEGVTIRAANVTVAAGSKISADGQGYTENMGPGAGAGRSDGGSYGGRGGGTAG